MNQTIHEPARDIPLRHKADICVLGGSCTGVFAAIRAARLGASVVLIEKQNCFGGVATNGLVNIWHSLYDTEAGSQIIGGLTAETIERLEKRDASCRQKPTPDTGCRINTEELKIELDAMIKENRITVLLHTMFCSAQIDDATVKAVFVENKDGRGAIQAGIFVDATGDGDLAYQCSIPFKIPEHIQPPTTCAKIRGMNGIKIREFYNTHRAEFGLPEDTGWNGSIPNIEDVRMYAETHAFGINCADAAQLTKAEMDERARIRAIMDMVRKYEPQRRKELCLLALGSYIGIRETRRFSAEYELTEEDVLEGVRFDDAIANGSYRVDVHYPSGGGFLFKYLDGTQCAITAKGHEPGRWRPERAENPVFYQIPYRTMVHQNIKNLIMSGRMISAEQPAYGAIRVMVNTNQTGEAAGTAAYLALQNGCTVSEVNPSELRSTLQAGGSIML